MSRTFYHAALMDGGRREFSKIPELQESDSGAVSGYGIIDAGHGSIAYRKGAKIDWVQSY